MVAVIAGHICIDLIPSLPGAPCVDGGRLVEVGPITLHTGGSVANTGLGLSQLGIPTRLAADIGADELGSVLLRAMTGPGVDTTGIRVLADQATSYSVVVQPPDADRTFWHHVGANAGFDGTAVEVSGATLLHVGYPTILPALARSKGAGLLTLLARAVAEGVTTSVDLAVMDPSSPLAAEDWTELLASMLPLVGVFAPSIDDLRSVLPRSLSDDPGAVADLGQELIDLGAAVVVLKAGAGGLYLRTGSRDRLRRAGRALAPCADAWADHELWAPSIAVAATSTTGAGDAAIAGFLYGLISALPPELALATAAASAAVRISTSGPLPPGDLLTARVGADLTFSPFDEPSWPVGPTGLAYGPRHRPVTEAQGAPSAC